MLIILLLKDKAGALSIPQYLLVLLAVLQLIISKYRYSIWLWIDLIVGIFKRGVGTGWKILSFRKKAECTVFPHSLWKKKMDRISFLCEGTGMAGQESLLACGLAFINSWDRGGGEFSYRKLVRHTPRVWIFQLAAADSSLWRHDKMISLSSQGGSPCSAVLRYGHFLFPLALRSGDNLGGKGLFWGPKLGSLPGSVFKKQSPYPKDNCLIFNSGKVSSCRTVLPIGSISLRLFPSPTESREKCCLLKP